MPGGMTPHTGQPTPMPNPGGAPMPGGPPIPPQQQQQPSRPPHQQVYKYNIRYTFQSFIKLKLYLYFLSKVGG